MKSLVKTVKKFKKSLRKTIQDDFNSKGLSLISTLVASVIGLIVIFGLNKSLVHLNTQSMQLKSEIKIQNLNRRVSDILANKCNFNELQDKIRFGETGEVEKSYGLKNPGMNYFDRSCLDNSGTTTCDIKMYYQVSNEFKYSPFSCSYPTPTP